MEVNSYSGSLAKKYAGREMPYWVLMELISFGPLIKLYRFCFQKNGYVHDAEEINVAKQANNLLRNAQVLRNAAAHGDCLLNNLARKSKSASRSGVKRRLLEYNIDQTCVTAVGSIYVAMDLAALLMCYDLIVTSADTRKAAANKLRALNKRLQHHKEWFEKNRAISAFLAYSNNLLLLFVDLFECEEDLSEVRAAGGND